MAARSSARYVLFRAGFAPDAQHLLEHHPTDDVGRNLMFCGLFEGCIHMRGHNVAGSCHGLCLFKFECRCAELGRRCEPTHLP